MKLLSDPFQVDPTGAAVKYHMELMDIQKKILGALSTLEWGACQTHAPHHVTTVKICLSSSNTLGISRAVRNIEHWALLPLDMGHG